MVRGVDTQRSTSEFVVTFASGAISSQSRLQKSVTLSITEVEFIATTEACKEIL